MNRTAKPVAVPPGTAEQLARLGHFRELEHTQPEELDYIALWLLGAVGDSETKWSLWEQLRDDCLHLWHLITDDWDDHDLDDLPDEPRLEGITDEHAETIRYEQTRERLIGDIEQTIWLARYRTAEATRPAVSA